MMIFHQAQLTPHGIAVLVFEATVKGLHSSKVFYAANYAGILLTSLQYAQPMSELC